MSSTDGKDKTKEFSELPEKEVKKPEAVSPIDTDIKAFKEKYGIDVEPVKNIKFKLNKVRTYIMDRYEFRYNLFAKKPEWKKKLTDIEIQAGKKTEYEYFEERDLDNFHNEIEFDLGVSISPARLASMIGSNKISFDYNPIRDYLYSLPKWDGKDRFKYFLTQIKLNRETEDERLILEKYFTRWFVTLVGSLLDHDVINEVAPVFSGEEGRGKTRFSESLVPKDLRLKYMYVGNFDPHNKDHEEMLGTKILIFLDEMRTISRTDSETLKSTFSKRRVILRRAYGRGNIHLYRQCSFIGAINDERFLTDTGANRRWLPFSIKMIDIYDDFNIDFLYAQAMSIFRNRNEEGSKFHLWFDQDEIKKFQQRNQKYRLLSPEEELIMLHWSIPTQDDIENSRDVDYLTAAQIMHELASMDQYRKMNTNDTVARRIGRIMHNLEDGNGNKFPIVQKRLKGFNNPRDCYAMKRNTQDYVLDIKRGKEQSDNLFNRMMDDPI